MSKLHSTLVDGLAKRNSESGDKWRFFRMPFRHFKIHLCDVEPVWEMIYEATAAPARAPFGKKSAISVRMHASEIERRPRLTAWRCFAWNTATIGGVNNAGVSGRERITQAILTPLGAHHRAESRDELRDSSSLGQGQYQPDARARDECKCRD
jgi:hypothetical protein